jgi:hypothetical protein
MAVLDGNLMTTEIIEIYFNSPLKHKSYVALYAESDPFAISDAITTHFRCTALSRGTGASQISKYLKARRPINAK